MPGPTFVNAGTAAEGLNATSVTFSAFPASLVNGNLLICIASSGLTSVNFTNNGVGWTQLFAPAAQFDTSNTLGVWYKITNGTESSFTVTCSGSNNYTVNVFQYTGVDATTPIRRYHRKRDTSNRVNVQEGKVPTVCNNSLVVNVVSGANLTVSSNAAAWTKNFGGGVRGPFQMWSNPVATAGWCDEFWVQYTGTNAGGGVGHCFFEICSASSPAARSLPYPCATEHPKQGNALGSIALDVPTGAVNGNVLTAILSTQAAGILPAAPTGWRVLTIGSNIGGGGVWLLWKVIDGTEGSTVTITFGTANVTFAFLQEWANIDTNCPFGPGGGFQTEALSTVPVIKGFTTQKNNSLAICYWGGGGTLAAGSVVGSGNWFPGQMMTAANMIWYQEMPSAGATGDTNFATMSAGTTSGVLTIEAYAPSTTVPKLTTIGTFAFIGTATATITPGNPAELANGNLLICVILEAVSTANTYSMPAGWTQFIGGNSSNSAAYQVAAFWKITNGTEGSNTVTRGTANAANFVAQILQYTGNRASNPVGRALRHYIENGVATLASDVGSRRTRANNSLLVGVSGGNHQHMNIMSPGWLYKWSNNTGGVGGTAWEYWESIVFSAGWTQDKYWTWSSSVAPVDDLTFEIYSEADQPVPLSPRIVARERALRFLSANSVAPKIPDNPVVGNLLLAVMYSNSVVTSPSASGWTLAYTVNTSGNGIFYFFTRLVTGSEGPTVTFTLTSTPTGCVKIYEIENVNSTTPLAAPSSVQSGTLPSAGNVTVTGWTTANANSLVLSFISDAQATSWSPGMVTPGTWVKEDMLNDYQVIVQDGLGSGASTGNYTVQNATASASTYAAFSMEVIAAPRPARSYAVIIG